MRGKLYVLVGVIMCTPILAGLYGVLHDQITYSISPEYFTKFKYDQFGLDPDWFGGHRQTVAVIGIWATWWTGLPIGMILGLVGLIHAHAKAMMAQVAKAFLITVVVTAVAGCLGYFYASHSVQDIYWTGHDNVENKFDFVTVLFIHNFSYAGSLVGLIGGVTYQILNKSAFRGPESRKTGISSRLVKLIF